MQINWRKLSNGNYAGRCGKMYISLKCIKHGRWDGFDKRISWWSAAIYEDKICIALEGHFGSSLNTLVKAKKWISDKIKQLK